MNNKIMAIPSITSQPNPYEEIVQIWLDSKGYITTTGKWFWVQKNPDTPAGYKDIVLLGVKEDEVILVSATTCLDDKIRLTRQGLMNDKMYQKNVVEYFNDVIKYLQNTPEYKWLLERKIRKIIFYFFGTRNQERLELLRKECKKNDVEIVSIEEAAENIKKYISSFSEGGKSERSIKTESPVFTLLNLFINEKRRNATGLDEILK